MRTLDLTRYGLIRALLAAVATRPAVDAAVAARAEAVAAEMRAAGVVADVVRRGSSDYAVRAAAPGPIAPAFMGAAREGDGP